MFEWLKIKKKKLLEHVVRGRWIQESGKCIKKMSDFPIPRTVNRFKDFWEQLGFTEVKKCSGVIKPVTQ